MDICGKRQQKKKGDSYHHLSKLDLCEEILRKKIKLLKKLTRRDLCNELQQLTQRLDDLQVKSKKQRLSSQPDLGYLKYSKNSCYLDSTLTALIHQPNEWINKYFLYAKEPFFTNKSLNTISKQVQALLLQMYKDLHEHKKQIYSTKLRGLFQTFDQLHALHGNDIVEWTHSQQEPRDVFNMLQQVLQIPEDVHVVITGSSTRVEKQSFNTVVLDVGILLSNKLVYLKDYVPITIDHIKSTSANLTKKTEIVDADCLVVDVQRNYLNTRKLTTSVIPVKFINIYNKQTNTHKKLHLVSMIIHHGSSTHSGHYTCFIKRGTRWYHYDDMDSAYKFVGNFKQVVEYDGGIVPKNVVTCVYTRIK